MNSKKPNILYMMCDQFRFDCIAALGNAKISTPNLDRLVRRGISFDNAYSPCPVCVPARYTIRSGSEPYSTGCYCNEEPQRPKGKEGEHVEEWTGPFLARTLAANEYRTFGIGKFHTYPEVYEDVGFEVHLHTEEMWDDVGLKEKDAFYSYLAEEHPEFTYLEQLHGERTNMYYMPQLSSLPKEHTVEAFVARKAVEQIEAQDTRPFFGFVSFIGPHPPCAPPIPYNRMYDPDGMDNPVVGPVEDDHLDEQIPWMNSLIYADEINDAWARNFKTRYYGEISYIDSCIGSILDAVEKLPDADNTLICFFADHGDMCGDHHAWQKECFYEGSVRIPFLLSYPRMLGKNERNTNLVSLTDLFALATSVAGCKEVRDGIDILLDQRKELFSYYGRPRSQQFKVMLRWEEWKFIYMANGGRQQLFNLSEDPLEMKNLVGRWPGLVDAMTKRVVQKFSQEEELRCMVSEGALVSYPFEARPLQRLHQFDFSQDITDFSMGSGAHFMSEAVLLKK
ncbi:MAG TPA: sulfatase-like hydrolase/transferase [Sphaerochaeta sp.]|nr:sulfatase-like hydrolase/transferase [Sphaerochaeta sp.]